MLLMSDHLFDPQILARLLQEPLGSDEVVLAVDSRISGHPTVDLDDVTRVHVVTVLERCRWRIDGRGNAAEALGVHPNTLRSRMKRLGIVRPQASR